MNITPCSRAVAGLFLLFLAVDPLQAEGAPEGMGMPDTTVPRLQGARSQALATERLEELARQLARADADYRSGRSAEALQGFLSALTIAPDNLPALLRLGNLHHQAGREDEAEAAYRRAVQVDLSRRPMSEPDLRAAREAQGKAWLNLALLHVARASRAIDELDALALRSIRSVRDTTARQVGALRHRAWRSAANDFGVDIPAAQSLPSGATSGSLADPATPTASEPSLATQPYTVDRWISLPRRAATRPSPGRSGVVEPITETPPDPPPTVEILRAPASNRR